MRGCCEELEIDTKDICLLCLGSRIATTCDDSPPSLPSSQGLKHLLRFLKVSPKQLFNCSSEFLQSMEIREDIDLKITLCTKCSSVTEKFNKLYHEFELIQLQFGNCVQSLHESISKGNESPERVRNYMDQMRPNKSSDLVNASIAANLRNETLKKCSLKLQSVTPRVQVASQILNVEKQSQLSKASEVENENGSDRGEVQSPEDEVNLRRETRSARSLPNTKKIQASRTSKVRVVSDKANMEKCSRPKSVGVEKCSVTIEKEIQLPKPERNLRRETRALQSAIKSQFVAEFKKLTNELQPEEIHVVSAAKHVTRKLRQRKSYFSSIRKKLKTKTKSKSFPRVVVKICEYCKMTYSSPQSLRLHMSAVHPELRISKFLPSNISSEQCKEGMHAVWKQMFEVSCRKCQFCSNNLSEIASLRRHIIGSHAEEFAVKVLEEIQLLSKTAQNPELTKGIIPTDTESNFGNNQTKNDSAKSRFSCEYCNCVYMSRISLKQHKSYAHPEHVISKFFPVHIPLNSCKQGVDAIFEQILKPSKSVFTCKFCTKIIPRKNVFKRHLVSMHAEQIALEAQQCLGLTEHLEAVSPDAEACSSMWGTHEYKCFNNASEDNNESKQLSVSLDIDFEEESLVKVENPLSANLELDPLDGDYMD